MKPTFAEFIASKVTGDPLLLDHPENAAVWLGCDRGYFSDKLPIRQFMYSFGDMNYLIEQDSEGRFIHGWHQGGDSWAATLEQAEIELYADLLNG